MQKKKTDQQIIFYIRHKGALRPSITDWLGEVTFTRLENSETLLAAIFPHQPALRGFLEPLWNLNFTILSDDQVGNEIDPFTLYAKHEEKNEDGNNKQYQYYGQRIF